MKLTSFGGAAGVTGSKHLLEADGKRLLVDCGMFQGEKAGRLRNWEPPPFAARSIDAVLLTHGHLDHCGYLPRLVQAGFRGPVYATRAGREVARVILMDSARLQEEDAEQANREGWSKHHPALPLYDTADVERTLHHFRSVEYGKPLQIGGLRIVFHYAGHILGAAGIRVDDGTESIWFSGDIGRLNDPVMFPPRPPKTILARAIAKAPPMTAAQNGIIGGSDRARMMPVTTALRSNREVGWARSLLQIHSAAMHAATQEAITMTACRRKNHTAAIIAGTRPMTTSSMIARVV